MGQGASEVSARQAGGSESVTDEMSLDDIRDAFGDALGVSDIVDDPNAKTAKELQEMWPNLSLTTVRGKANKAVAAGKMEAVRVIRPDARGHRVEQTGYRVIK